MTINFELLKASKMTSLKIYLSPVLQKLETSNLEGKPHWKGSIGTLLQELMTSLNTSYSAVPRCIFIPLNWYGCPKNEPKFLKTSPNFFIFNQFNNCPFFLPNYFITGYTKVSNHLQPSTTTQKLPQKAKTCHKQLCYCTLDFNTEIDVDFDSDMKQ